MKVQLETKTENKVGVRTSCRVCNNDELKPVLSLGEQYVSNFVEATDEQVLAAPLELVLCDADSDGCGLLQLRHTVDSEEMYRNYWYRSGVNQTMRDALADIVQKVEQFVPLTAGDLVIDIGSNDNTLLKAYKTEDLTRIGFEPAKTIMPYATEGATKIINDYFTKEGVDDLRLNKKAKSITAIAMFYDLEEPNKFVADVKECLAADGIFIIQQAYLPLMLQDNIFDNICHEHLEYYSLLSLEALLSRHNLEIIDVELNDVNGGSFRTYIAHKDSPIKSPLDEAQDRLNNMRLLEKKMELSSIEAYSGFADRVEEIKKQVVDFIQKEVAAGKKVYVYGASTKGNTLLQYFGLDSSIITAAADRNPDKWGKKTVGTNIPIVSEAEARAAQPDYFFVLPWHFMPEFKQREQAFLNQGGKFIVPLPKFKIISS